MDIREIDPNFAQNSDADQENTVYYAVTEPPFSLYGVFYEREEKRFLRMPSAVAASVSENVAILNGNTAGGRVRFSTDSPFLTLAARYPSLSIMSHMPLSGSSGFTLCENTPRGEKLVCTMRPEWRDADRFLRRIPLGGGLRRYTLYFPLYNDVSDMALGFDRGARVGRGKPYRSIAPIVYYGSSITQGGCACRADHSYQALISKRNNIDFINLGFSGNAKGEAAMARYLGGLACSVAVIDYDHNAPNAEHLAATHEPFYKIFRAAQPETPVVFVTKPDFYGDAEGERRLEIIRGTYSRALAAGDRKVAFVDGRKLFGRLQAECTVDGCHPNDMGFYRMAEVIGRAVNGALRGRYD